MKQLGVIEKIEEPTEWCAGLVVVPKQSGKVRICVDLTKLNENVCRERHPLPAVEQVLAQLSGATVFSILDANSGFWQIPLSGICSFNNIYFPIREILLSSIAFWNNFSSRAFSTTNVLYFEWAYWGCLFNGRRFGTWGISGTT